MTNEKIILGIDPGLNHTGYGIIRAVDSTITFVAAGTIAPPKKLDDTKILLMIYNELNHIIQLHQPKVMVLEQIFYQKNAKTSMKLAAARSMPMLLAGLYQLTLYEFSATHVKKIVTNFGHADKLQLQKMLQLLLPTAIFHNDHEADALALAISGLYPPNFNLKP